MSKKVTKIGSGYYFNCFAMKTIIAALGKKVIKLQAPKAAPANGPMKKGPMKKGNNITNEIQVLTFKLKSEYNPQIWLQLLTKFSSFEINNIEYGINNNSWNYEGVFYVL